MIMFVFFPRPALFVCSDSPSLSVHLYLLWKTKKKSPFSSSLCVAVFSLFLRSLLFVTCDDCYSYGDSFVLSLWLHNRTGAAVAAGA
jgi:hypothetical protein